MAEESFQERTEQATPKRREEARKQGQVARSVELNSVAIILAGILALHFGGGALLNSISLFTVETLSSSHEITLSIASLPVYLRRWAVLSFVMLSPLLLIIAVSGLAINLLQVGFTVSNEALAPKFNRLNPLSGLKRLFSTRAIAEALKGLFKIGIVGFILYKEVMKHAPELLAMADSGVGDILEVVGRLAFGMSVRVAIFLTILAVLDYAFQRWEFERSMRMTKQQVKEELRQTEGDPQVRARIRALQRETARRRMLEEVPKADVVITNPTHYAVALKYEAAKMPAPTIVAKGQNLIAQKIREIAEEAGVPIVENPPLAQALYKAVDIGREVPEDLYRAVAEVLAYVFRLKRKTV